MHVFCHFHTHFFDQHFPYSCIPLKPFFFYYIMPSSMIISKASLYKSICTQFFVTKPELICKFYRGGLRRWAHAYILKWNICFATDVKLHGDCIISMVFYVAHKCTFGNGNRRMAYWDLGMVKIHSDIHQYLSLDIINFSY